MVNGQKWLVGRIAEYLLWGNAGTSAYQLQPAGDLKSDKIRVCNNGE